MLADLGWRDDRRPWVAGQSWGANVVLELAARHPDATGGVVLVDGGTIELASRFADWPTCEAALAPPPLIGTPAAGFERMIRAHHPDWPESGIAGTLANVEVLPDGTIRPVAVAGPPHDDPAPPVGAPAVRALPAGQGARSCSCRPRTRPTSAGWPASATRSPGPAPALAGR